MIHSGVGQDKKSYVWIQSEAGGEDSMKRVEIPSTLDGVTNFMLKSPNYKKLDYDTMLQVKPSAYRTSKAGEVNNKTEPIFAKYFDNQYRFNENDDELAEELQNTLGIPVTPSDALDDDVIVFGDPNDPENSIEIDFDSFWGSGRPEGEDPIKVFNDWLGEKYPAMKRKKDKIAKKTNKKATTTYDDPNAPLRTSPTEGTTAKPIEGTFTTPQGKPLTPQGTVKSITEPPTRQ